MDGGLLSGRTMMRWLWSVFGAVVGGHGTGAAGRIYCLPVEQSELKSGLAVPFSMWQCGGHGDAAGSGFVH